MRLSSVVLLVLVAAPTRAAVSGGAAQEPATPKPPAGAPAQPGPESPVYRVAGAYAFRTYCASCHGTDGRGEGPLAENLRFHPPDLTLIAKRNGGDFPAERIHRIVDGRKPLPGHGGPDMPIWGDAFKNAETGYEDTRVREKIRSLVDYLKTIQTPTK